MTQMEMNFLRQRRIKLEERFKQRYVVPFTVRDGKPCFQPRGNYFFLVTSLKFPNGDEAIVLEFADTLETAKRDIFEDGDLYYMDEMNEEEMFQAMVKEIENE